MRRYLPVIVIALICTLLGAAIATVVLVSLPSPGTPPAIYDTFAWNSTRDGFWHVHAYGASTVVDNSRLTLEGNSIELDRLLQTDPKTTIVVARVRGVSFHKFAIGIGSYHNGTITTEFDNDGAKCGWGSGQGWQVAFIKGWAVPPVGKWFYVEVRVVNPYPGWTPQQLSTLNSQTEKAPVITCALFDSSGKLIGAVTPTAPAFGLSNAHYVALDEAFMRTWDSQNDYQIDWFYAGPPSGLPMHLVLPKAPPAQAPAGIAEASP